MAIRLNAPAAAAEVQRRGHTITEVANALGIERTYMSRCLTGARNLPAELIPVLADFLGVDPFRLLGPEDPRDAVVELARLYKVKPDELVA